jgi:hypothetical protein
MLTPEVNGIFSHDNGVLTVYPQTKTILTNDVKIQFL